MGKDTYKQCMERVMFGKDEGQGNKKQRTGKWKKTARFDRLEAMLEEAINDTFQESDYDESRLSRLEVKWKRFLTSSVSSKRRLQEEQDRIKMLISDISHQTKTPLANILLYTQLLQEKETDPELLSIAENIREQSEKLHFLIQSLVKTSRLESEQFVLQPKRQLILPCLKAAAAGAEEEAAKKQIRILVEATETEGCFDRKWTEEAIGNLLDNSIKYSPVGSQVEICVKDYEMFAAVCVKDTGIGIKEEEQAQVFNRFYRSSEVAEEKGVGIGLYLVREIARRQNGYVKVKSEYGKGSAFFFYIYKG